MQQIYPERQPVDDPLSIYDRVEFPVLPDRAYLYANMVSSVDGRVQLNGKAAGIGSPTDQKMMRRLRALADAVVNGAGTFDAEDVYAPIEPKLAEMRRARGQAEQPLWAVATGSGKVRLDADMFKKDGRRPIAFIAERTPKARREELAKLAEVVVCGDEHPEPRQMLTILRRDYDCRHVLSEGGPVFNMANVRAGTLDELFLTFAPKLVAGDGKNIVEGDQFPADALPRIEPVTIFEHEQELFFRYRFTREKKG